MRLTALIAAILASFTLPALSQVPPLEQVMADRVMGKADAPVTMIEYASLTCSHCAHFATEILPQIEKEAIDTGKMRLIYRDYPLDGTALKAAALARCMPTAQYFPFIKVLFSRQASWATEQNPEEPLAKLASLAGMSAEKSKACMSDTKILDALAAKRLEAQTKYKVQATPSFIFNDGTEKIDGAAQPAKYMEIIDRLAAQKK